MSKCDVHSINQSINQNAFIQRHYVASKSEALMHFLFLWIIYVD